MAPDGREMGSAEQMLLMDAVDDAFRPSGPVDQQDLFSGRNNEIASVTEATRSRGSHAIIFGERGVGKTSLSLICGELQQDRGNLAVRINCDTGDNFASLWPKVLAEVAIFLTEAEDLRATLTPRLAEAQAAIDKFELGPADVRLSLRYLTAACPLVVFLDEFDQIEDSGAKYLLANLMKMLSDHLEPVTLIPVGVADSVDELVAGHQSIVRSMAQVKMPRMSETELEAVALRGFGSLEMTADPESLKFIATAPRGLPQYAHLIAQEAARQAVIRQSYDINMADILNGLRVGVSKVDHTLTEAYELAVYSPQENRFKEVLLACATTDPDKHGWFAPADIRLSYSGIMGRDLSVPHYNPQLTQLSTPARGEILTREGEPRRWRYRFTDPLMEPFVILRGIDDGLISAADVVAGLSA